MKRQKLNTIQFLRKRRTRQKIGKGTKARPRLSVFRSNRYTYAQLIDDTSGKTLVSVSSHEVKEKLKKAEVARQVGLLVAQRAKKAGIQLIVFDRGRYAYHGRVKAVADGAREGGLKL
jgi:large subunit ribosomal protein L18